MKGVEAIDRERLKASRMSDSRVRERSAAGRGSSVCRIGIVMVATLLAFSGLAADEPELRLASDEWPPFTGDPGTSRIAIKIVHVALERAGIAAETTIVRWRDVEQGIRRGTFEGSAAMWRSDSRERDLLYSDPYLENRLVLVGRKGSDVRAKTISDLGGKRVAAVGHYAYGEEIDSAQGVYFVNGRNDQENLDKLLAGDVDYMLVDALVALYLATNQAEEATAKLEFGTTPLARRTLHFVLRRNVADADRIINAFNKELRGMFADGTFAQILQLGWIRVDIDGDGREEVVALGDRVGLVPPGSVYDVFGKVPTAPPEKERFVIDGKVYEGWDAIPEQYKAQGPADYMDTTFKQGTTVYKLQF
jgi:ABC-type amino acid transport substrate-binding protein